MSEKCTVNKLRIRGNKTLYGVALILILTFAFLPLLLNQSVSVAKAQTVTATATTSSNLLQYEWVNPRSTPEGTFFSAGPAPNSPSIQWKTQIPAIGGVMAAFDGFVFASNAFGTVYALNASTGSIVWKLPTQPGITGDTIYKLDDTYMLIANVCVYTANGTVAWTAPAGFLGGAIDFNGAGYVPELKMFLSSSEGWNLPDPAKPPTLAWNITNTQNEASLQIGCVYGGGKLFVGGLDGFLRAYDAKTGTLLWAAPLSSSCMYGMTYDNGMVFFGGLDNNMRAWNATTGQLLWTYNPHTFYGMWASSTGAAYGMVYEHNEDTYLYAINQTNGKLVWRAKGPGIGYSNILAIADGKVYCQMGENEYRNFNTGQYAYSEYDCYNAYTGQLIWSLPMENGAPFNSQCIAYGNLYVCPTTSTGVPGQWSYNILGMGSIGEVWCIGSTPTNWSMFMANPTHSGEGTGPTNLTVRWTFNTGAEVISPSTIVNGVCYVGSVNGNIYALNANDGTKLWAFKTGYEVTSEVAVVNGRVYTGADDGNIYCLNAATGDKIWETPAGGVTVSQVSQGTIPIIRSSPEVFDGRVYVGSLDGNLYCLDANSGAVLWEFQTGGQILATPAIDNSGVYVPSNTPGNNGTVYKLNPNTGNVIWQDSIPYLNYLSEAMGNEGGLYASPTLVPDLGMVLLRNGLVTNYALNATTGNVIWTYNATTNAAGTSFQAGGVPQVGAPLYAHGAVYINDYYSITCLNALNGSKIWSTWLSREDNSQGISYAYGRIYVVNELGNLYVLNAQTGDKMSYYSFGGPQMHSMPTLYNGSLYVGCNDWNVYCFGDARIMSAQSATQQTTTISPAPSPRTSSSETSPTPSTPQSPSPTTTPSPTQPPTPTTTSTVSSSPAPAPSQGPSTETYLVATAASVIIIVTAAAAVVILRRRRTK